MDLPLSIIHTANKIIPNEVDLFVESMSEKVPVSIRWNRNKKYFNSIEEKVPWTSHSEYLIERKSFTLDPIFHAGAYYVQEASSMFLEFILEHLPIEKQNLKVLDACASPGGKSTIISTWLQSNGILVANEIVKHRANILLENIVKWGLGNTMVTSNDPKSFSPFASVFDIVLVDAPCSGEGMFRKDKNALLEWSDKQVDNCVIRQKEILTNIIPCIKNGGYLIYSTCTFNTKENEEIIDWINSEFDFIAVPEFIIDPTWGIVVTEASGHACYRFFPHKLKGEGLFYCVMQRVADDKNETRQKIKKNNPLNNSELETFKNWVNIRTNYELVLENNIVRITPTEMIAFKKLLEQNLFILDFGTQVAEIKGKDFIPQHALAMSCQINSENFFSIELNIADSLKFLHKETFLVDSKNSGWHLLTYLKYPLGWGKITNSRMNNYYPKEWRIRMSIES